MTQKDMATENHENALGVRRRQIPKDFWEEVENVAPELSPASAADGWPGMGVMTVELRSYSE